MADRNVRIERLGQRFKTHAIGRPARSDRNRERKSFYLDTEVTRRLDDTYKEVDHDLYRQGGVSKSAFLETLLEYSLGHLDEIKQLLSDGSDGSDTSEQS
jgi:hypothetical protein